MQRLLIIASLIIVVATTAMTPQWQVLKFPRNQSNWGTYFISSDTGFVINANDCFITTNGGLQWSRTGPGGYSIHFPSPTVGYIGGRNILKTTDGGMKWRDVRLHPDNDRVYTSVNFIDDTTGVAVGNCFDEHPSALDYDIALTTDGGKQWTTPKFAPFVVLVGCPGPVLLRRASRSYLTSSYRDQLLFSQTWFSTDRGLTWGISDLDLMWGGFFHFRIKSMCFSDSNTMWVGGARDTIRSPSEMKNKRVFRTQNANDTGELVFDTVSYVFPYTVTTITFADELRGFIGDTAGNIYSTTDGGTTWKNDNVPSDGRSINSISIAGGSRVFAVGDGGLILRYDLLVSVQESNNTRPLLLFPNPTTGRVRVDVGNAEAAVITIIDMMGRLREVAMVSNNELDVSMLPTGTYVVVVRRGTRMSTELLVKRNE